MIGEDRYDEGYNDGYDDGRDEGYDEGYADGEEAAARNYEDDLAELEADNAKLREELSVLRVAYIGAGK